MAFFHIFIHGEQFLLNRGGKDEWLNFFKNVYVEADTADEAEGYAIQRGVTDQAFRAQRSGRAADMLTTTKSDPA